MRIAIRRPKRVYFSGRGLPALGELVQGERAQGTREQVRGAESTRHTTAVRLHEEGHCAAAAEYRRVRAVEQLPSSGGEACQPRSVRRKVEQTSMRVWDQL